MTGLQTTRKYFGQLASKSLRSSSCSFSATTTANSQPIVELREYRVLPQYIASFRKDAESTADLRKDLAPLRFFSQPETGGDLNVATHAYYFEGGLSERDEIRKSMEASPKWQAYTTSTRHYLHSQKSSIFAEAPLVRDMNLTGLAMAPPLEPGADTIIELRRYKLKLGYDTVPKFLELYGEGLPSKLNAEGTDPTTSLVTLLYSEVGRLNEVIEVWKHGNGVAAMEQSRVAARKAQEWRTAIASIADLAIEFSATIHRPLSFSPVR